MQNSPLGSRLVSALPISIEGELQNYSADFYPHINSSVLLQINKRLVHIKPTATKQSKPPNKIRVQYYGYNVLCTNISTMYEIKIQ
jgi:hypothetical protein